jgi:hypothetical protein
MEKNYKQMLSYIDLSVHSISYQKVVLNFRISYTTSNKTYC